MEKINTIKNAIEIRDVHCQAKHKEILHGVSLNVKVGEVMGLLGPNGAGKTTLIRLICGLGRVSSGEIKIMGQAADIYRDVKIKRLIGLVPQENNMERELTIRESMVCYAELYGIRNSKQKVAEIMEQFGITAWGDKKPDEISGGMHRRAMIARAAIPEPEILILDEPSVGLDPVMRQDIWQQVRQLKQDGKTILITTHYMEEAEELCSRIALMKNGRLLMVDTAAGIKQAVSSGGNVTLEEAYLELVKNGEAGK